MSHFQALMEIRDLQYMRTPAAKREQPAINTAHMVWQTSGRHGSLHLGRGLKDIRVGQWKVVHFLPPHVVLQAHAPASDMQSRS